MSQLRYYTVAALEELRQTIHQHLDWYYAPTGELPNFVLPPGVRDSQLTAPALAGRLKTDPHSAPSTDVDNALAVYESLPALTVHQASIERMWAHLCHCDCPQYVAERWLNRRPEKEEDAVREVRNHFFAIGNRALIRDNGVSRLWWLGKIASEVDKENPRQFLTILLHRQDVRSALIERPSVSMNRKVLRSIYTIMKEHWSGGGALFERETFRSWMVALNRRGGVVLLDALPNDTLGSLLSEEAESAITSAQHG